MGRGSSLSYLFCECGRAYRIKQSHSVEVSVDYEYSTQEYLTKLLGKLKNKINRGR